MARTADGDSRRSAGDARTPASRSPLPDDQLDALIAVLDEIRHDHAHTRPELIRRTGLSRAVVAQRVGELLERGLIEDGELGESRGGRAPRLLRFRARAGHLLVADLGATSIDVAIADLSGRILAHWEEPAQISDGPEPILSRVEVLFGQLLEHTADVPGELWGVGIGLPAPVEFSSGRAVSPPLMPTWDGYPVRDRFVERYHVPTWVDNDVNVMALGERRAGIARGHDNAIFIKLGTGIGTGIIASGRLHRGEQGCAGDVGHIQVGEDVVCWCGRVGCLEALAGGAALARDGEAAARSGKSDALREVLRAKGSVEAIDVVAAAGQGDPVSRELVARSGRLIGQVVAMVVSIFNPSMVVVGGGLSKAGDALLASIREAVYGRSLPLATRDLVVQRSALEGLGGVTGAATMVLDELFSHRQIGAWLHAGTPAVLVGQQAVAVR
jgi:glucokinase-like ROK family protein